MSVIYRYSRPAERKLARTTLMQLQSGRCGGCFGSPNTLHVDHDHDTDWIRGMLCAACNIGEGHGASAFA